MITAERQESRIASLRNLGESANTVNCVSYFETVEKSANFGRREKGKK